MIYSDRQLSISKTALEKLKADLKASEGKSGKESSWLDKLGLDALRSQVADIDSEITDYELLRSGQVSFAKTCSLSELPRVLVSARIARGLSQSDLAERLGMKPQQIQRYEATQYQGANLARLIEIANELGVKASESFEGNAATSSGAIFSWPDVSDIIWARFPLKEMQKRNWFSATSGENLVNAAKSFFLQGAGPQFASALHRKKVRSGNVPNEYALLAWQARVLFKAREFRKANKLSTFALDDTWLGELTALTKHDDGPIRARDLLATRGIVLIIERHLPGTYLDGAAMLSDDGVPVVALTLRYDRLDNFWFVLFHELAHVFLHLFDGLKFDFFDEEDGAASDELEKQADTFALDKLIPPAVWDQCLSRFALSAEAVRNDAERLGISQSVIAGRIRKERNNYMILTKLVGTNTVRSQFDGVQP
jgi:HTH-type transcriptional regulator / antitoxin HigA